MGCHMTMDLFCQEMREARWDRSESLGPLVHCVHSAGKILLQKNGRDGCMESQLSQQTRGRVATERTGVW